MRSNLFCRALLGSLFLVCLAGAGSQARVAAQDAGNTPADTHDDGFDKGLLGLAGLAGLLGLRRRDHHDTKRSGIKRSDVSQTTAGQV
jgi:MYXO-CTERM domain-containing protein